MCVREIYVEWMLSASVVFRGFDFRYLMTMFTEDFLLPVPSFADEPASRLHAGVYPKMVSIRESFQA